MKGTQIEQNGWSIELIKSQRMYKKKNIVHQRREYKRVVQKGAEGLNALSGPD
jgi:hypothetical protein